jgi:cephalosporin hydroxylase
MALARVAFARWLLTHGDAPEDVFTAYHRWFYESGVPFRLTWEGIPAIKSPLDMWVYQQLIWELRPSLVIEFGTNRGGSAVYFARILAALGDERCVLTIDIEQAQVDPKVLGMENVQFHHSSTVDASVPQRIHELRSSFPGPVFAILDSDHSSEHVVREIEVITPLLRTGDRLVVEDTNINGNPVLPGWGPGPLEAVQEFLARSPQSYERDRASEDLFGWSFARSGFLIRS